MTIRARFCLLAVLIAIVSASAAGRTPIISDYGAACDWCDSYAVNPVEGIWEFPEDLTRVLIRVSSNHPGLYDIIVVDSPDTRLEAGDKIGYLKRTPDREKFEMGLFRTKLKSGVLSELGKCSAQFDPKEEAIYVKGRSLKFSIGSRWLLPSFWRILRVSIKDPLQSLPKGMVRVYPTSKRNFPEYL